MLKKKWNEMNEIFSPPQLALYLMVTVPTLSFGIYLAVWAWTPVFRKLFF